MQILGCEFSDNKYNGIVLSHVQTLVKTSIFANNVGYAIRIHSSEHQPLLRLDYISEKEYKRSVLGFVGGPWGHLNFSDTRQDKGGGLTRFFACCISAKPTDLANSTSLAQVSRTSPTNQGSPPK